MPADWADWRYRATAVGEAHVLDIRRYLARRLLWGRAI
jgi:hypothetical protein